MMVIICASAFVIKACPPDFQVGTVAAKGANAPAVKDSDFRVMLKSADFYMMMLIMLCGAFSGMMVISQASQIAQRMMALTPAKAAVIVSVIALFNTLGRLASGSISDKVGATGTMRITFGVSLVASVLLAICGDSSLILFCICLAAIGFAFGSIMGIYPGFTAQRFGRKYNSVNYGIMFVGFALAGFFGPIVITNIFKTAGRYQPAFLIAAVLAVVGEVLIVFLRRSLNKREA